MDIKDTKNNEDEQSKEKVADETITGHAMDHLIIKISDGKTTKEVINTRG